MFWRYIGRPICVLIVTFPEAFVFVVTAVGMIGLGFVYQLYGTEAAIAVVVASIVLAFWLERRQGVPLPDMSGPPEPLALPGDTPPGLPGPTAQARLSSTRTAKVIGKSPAGIFPAVSGRRDGRPAPSGLRLPRD